MNNPYSDASIAFDAAIARGLLSASRTAEAYAGNYMYMGWTESRGAAFKNIDTRSYVYLPNAERS